MRRWLISFALFLLFISNRQPAAAQTADPRFGVVESYESASDATTLGVSWTRVRFQWAEVQAGGPDTWTPTVSEAQIDTEISNGRLVVGLLIGVPDWARDDGRLPAGLWLPPDDPGNSWANFVREAVERYNGRINHWIIWNEPDIADPTALGHTWDGSVEDFVQLQRVAYLVAKEGNANAVIHLPAFTHFWDPTYFDRFLATLTADPAAAQHEHYFNVATAHLYFQANSIYDIIQTFQATMGGYGLSKPIWLVETNAPPIDDPTWPVPDWTLSVTQNEQAAFVPQALASALAAGAERMALYKLKDTPEDRAANPEPFGLVRQDGRRRPAYSTYRFAIRYLAGVTAASRERWDGVGQIRLDQDEQRTTVLFARLPQPQQAQVVAASETAVLVDMWGQRQTITAENGTYTIELPGALCTQTIGDHCMIGGTTYYLVQAVAENSDPLPSPTAVPTFTPTPLPPTATNTATPAPTVTPTATAIDTATAAPTHTATIVPTPSSTPTVVRITAVPPTSTILPPNTGPTVPPSYKMLYLLGSAVFLGGSLGLWWWKSGRASSVT